MKSRSYLMKTTKGNVAIEFAIVLPVIFLVLSGVINFGLILINQNQLNAVASAGILYAYGNSPNPVTIQSIMNDATNITPLTVTATQVCNCLPGGNIACTGTCPSGTPPNTYISVTAQSQVSLLAPDFTITNPFVTNAQATIRVN